MRDKSVVDDHLHGLARSERRARARRAERHPASRRATFLLFALAFVCIAIFSALQRQGVLTWLPVGVVLLVLIIAGGQVIDLVQRRRMRVDLLDDEPERCRDCGQICCDLPRCPECGLTRT
ncbi:MAG: hypothetical protein AB8G96_07445 [Phycisphaerales bacterium]